MRLDTVLEMHNYFKANVLIVGYRGYGHSTCSPSEKGLMIDGRAILGYAFSTSEIDPDNIFVFGASMGGATAIYSSTFYQDKIKGLILMNTFTNLPDVVDGMNLLFKIFRPLVLSNFWPSNERIGELKLPILFISGREDEMIPKEHMDELFDLAVNVKYKNIIKIKGGHHNDTL